MHAFLQNKVAWKGRKVAVMLDSDAWSNPTVRKGEEIVATALANAGAQPFIARVPLFPDSPKLGADDFLVRVGPDALEEHLLAAKPWAPPKERSSWPMWSPKRHLELEAFLFTHLPPGARVQARDLYGAYSHWCAEFYVPRVSETLFARKVPEVAKVKKTASRGNSFWQRIG